MEPDNAAARAPFVPSKVLVGRRGRAEPQAAVGASVGCFAGAGYGLAVGFGRVRAVGGAFSLVRPGAAPFAHDGAVAGAFCGVFVGAGFAAAVAVHLGYSWRILADLLPARARRDARRDARAPHERAPLPRARRYLRALGAGVGGRGSATATAPRAALLEQ